MSQPDLKSAKRQSRAISPEKLNRLPPHSIESEQGVLGCIMLGGLAIISELQASGFDEQQFYHLPHRVIYKSACHVAQQSNVDMLLLVEHLKSRSYLEAVGGIAYIASLGEAVPSAANISYYADIVREKYLLRSMLRAASDLTEDIYECESNVTALVTQFQQKALSIGAWQRGGFIDAKAFTQAAIDFIEERHKAAEEGKVIGIPTGIRPIDNMISGMQDGDVVFIAARPSCGKTSMLWQICEHVACSQGLPVGVFSLEMSAKSLGARVLCSMAGVSPVRGLLTERDFSKLAAAAGKLSTSKIYMDEQAGIPISTLRARARQMKQLYGVRLVAVDYLQLVHGDGRADTREREVASVSQGLKEMAKELGIVVLVAVQFNREAGKRETKPKLTDFRDSGQLEQDADVAIGLYKPDPDSETSDACQTHALVMKQRNGPTGDIPLVFLKRTTRFEDAAIHEIP